MAYRKKLIEVALPLDAINQASAREKSIRHGHPSTLHLWWARRPLAAARAVIFAQMVDDPSGYADVLLSDPKRRRAAMRALKRRRAEHVTTAAGSVEPWAGNLPFQPNRPARWPTRRRVSSRIAKRFVTWRRSWSGTACSGSSKSWSSGKTPPTSRCWNGHGTEIRQSWRRACAENADHPRAREIFDRHRLPAFHDPLAGGGALPLEAQRLGLEAHASDDGVPLHDGGTGATAYADAVGVYLGITVSRLANRHAFLSFWDPMRQTVQLGNL